MYTIPVEIPLTLVVDATYVVHGLTGANKSKFQKGSNGDIWTDIYQMMEARRTPVAVEKVKSHILSKPAAEHEDRSDVQYNRMTLNETGGESTSTKYWQTQQPGRSRNAYAEDWQPSKQQSGEAREFWHRHSTASPKHTRKPPATSSSEKHTAPSSKLER